LNLRTTAVPGVYSDNWLVHLIGVPIPQETWEGFEIQAHSATVDLDSDPSFLFERYFVNIWHILQESFSNIEKYANAKNVSMSLATCEGDIYLAITDDGDEFDLETAELGRGYGLPNIKDRAERLGGVLYIESSPGAGTKLDVKVPLSVPPARPLLG
jgi:signal transduction histidine kinase